ncbi:MAG TPA: TRAP transporter substrate-binding protein DctP [Candidatus Acidoferrum sp.]|nr:TRAP transporter substrate-binding protein DctP [Candidatus Acidoferrum sp.]
MTRNSQCSSRSCGDQPRWTRRSFVPAAAALGLGLLAGASEVLAAPGPIRVRLGTLAPKGSSYYKELAAMGEKWRLASNGGVLLTIYPDGTMGGEKDMVQRMRLGQLQAGLLTTSGLADIEPGASGLQFMPMAFRTLEEVDYIVQKLQPMLEKRLEAKGFVALFLSDTGWVRFFSKDPVIGPDDLRKTKMFVEAGSPAYVDLYRSVRLNPVPLEAVDILPNLQTGLINAAPLPPSYALAGQVDRVAPNMLDLAWVPLVGALVVSKKTWDAIPPETREAMGQAAVEAGAKMKAEGRRESVESVEAMRKRGLTVHPLTPEAEVQWQREMDLVYPKIRGTIVPADIFDEVTNQLAAYRAAQPHK